MNEKEIKIREHILSSKPMSYLIVGKRGSGKTELAKRIVATVKAEKKYIFSHNVFPEWNREDVKYTNEFSSIVDTFVKDCEDKKGVDLPPTVFVFDEMDLRKVSKTPEFTKLIVCGRHYNATIIIIHRPTSDCASDEYDRALHRFPPVIRVNLCNIVLTLVGKEDLRMLYEDYFRERDSFREFVAVATETFSAKKYLIKSNVVLGDSLGYISRGV